MNNSSSSASHYESDHSDGITQMNEMAFAKFDFNAQKVYILSNEELFN